MKILVTGAQGFVGRHVVAHLQACGHEVVRVVRNPAQGCIAVGDMARFQGWDALLEGVECVMHLAARAHQIKDRAEDPYAAFYAANVTATQHLVDACVRVGVPHFIYLSTVAVCGYDSSDAPYDASSYAPYNPYSSTKAQAEALVKSCGIPATIMRIPIVYGAGVRANFLSLMRYVDRGVPLPFGQVCNQRSVLYVGNLAHALEQCARTPAVHGATLMIADSAPLSSKELVGMIADALGTKARLVPMPPMWVRAITGLCGKEMIYHKLYGSLHMDCTPSYEVLDWMPPYITQQGLRETVAWFRTMP
ncbi:MAG: NAD-dependent epimerase/dehydratase family protein [Alphaproteobacteria bacterium]|nr:MAG: NAD-dependent epimerase/dehydratase family protein [Alphaproteobacteria bacterium]TAF13862.1 MAG: NAD-dependent epimerase/dehydratase family protein [Alphaproteobacteria bacterium]TAF39854.1 MAG: NAD-dependent epimerase/dehydratase family protein [Alphaproteobacteria bacterium]TAF75696.1 MAG: NAD-dependent epimerase/dehydratase family protein [Alphaproteobacteria bacterium]